MLHAPPISLKPFGCVNEIKGGGGGRCTKTEPTEHVVFWSAGPTDRGLGRTLLYKSLEKQNVELWAGHIC